MKTTTRWQILCIVLSSFFITAQFAEAQSRKKKVDPALPDSWSEKIEFRSIGPANMSGRITSIAVYEDDPCIWWAASASGGLLKTTNNGINFEHQFDDQSTVSIGDVQVSKTDPDLLWVGTGEGNPRNSVSWGDGVYKSTDGGKSWKNMGLKKTFQIGRIAIHPEDHDTVYVGALGRLWGPNPERGLFKTTDGGKTWKKILFIDDKTGVIDVQMNPENPDELLVATYERMRDGFDGNDPIKKYGDGSAIYKTTDGGKTFNRLSQGLPSCKLGRIGLSYFAANPSIIAAIVESEKIAKEPDTAAYAGIRGEDADVGAKITEVVKDGPAEKAGLKENDIVVSVDGEIVYSYQDLLGGIRKNQAGDTTKLVVSRDRKPVDIAIELAKKPVRKGRNGQARRGRSPFTGTLGGQAANLQGQQGDKEQEYGGVYLSKDGGESWKRINTLNPRPMYYSQIRIDPTDEKNMYVLGTSLYRSKDGGKTFTGDGGRGIHVDHHALWIDPTDSRHMILGNDGGIHVTHDRMDNWDHLNHVAIGQFYHGGIGTRLNYRVYGGLQDNGSWGGPSRVSNDSGSVNTDWFRVGGGDGFITLVDPDDPDQIYFESQNGSMGRVNLRTGDRGFIRPRPPRGTRYRFNWKTPFILSPHNSKIHYSAGNYVFRSFNRGAGIKAISPEITNTDKGSGSAISESPVQAGVLYAGTTDGAVWMTKDGGKEWIALYQEKQKPTKKDDDKQDNVDEQKSESDTKAEDEKGKDVKQNPKEKKNESAESKKKSVIDGTWNGKLISDRFPEGQEPSISFMLKVDGKGKVSGEIETRRGPQEITEGSFDNETGELVVVVETRRGRREFVAKLDGKILTGEMSMRDGQITVEFEAEKQDDPANADPATVVQVLLGSKLLASKLTPIGSDDPISGKWKCNVQSDQLPDGEMSFDMELKMDKENFLTGSISSPQGDFEITDGSYKPNTNKVYFYGENDDDVFVDFEGTLEDGQIVGNASVNDTFTVEFSAKRISSEKETDTEQQEANEGSKQEPEDTSPRGGGFLGVFLENDLTLVGTVEGSPARSAGLKAGDTIEAVNGKTISSRDQLLFALSKLSAGDEVTLKINRDDSSDDYKIVLAKVPGNVSELQPSQQEEQEVQTEKETKAQESADKKTDNVNDEVAGTWKGTIETNQGESELTIELKTDSAGKLTGSYQTTRSDGEITEGNFDKETGELNLVADSSRFSLDFVGKVENEKFEGEIEFNQGDFTMPFTAKRIAKSSKSEETASPAVEEKTADTSGKTLKDLMPGPRWVSSIEASRFKAERCYISFDGHRSNDDEPYLFVTEDFGKSWNSIRGNLPTSAGSVRVLREDRRNQDVLYLGCEFGAWVSIDRGKTWTKFKNLPTVAVHEIAQHATLDDVLIATHGRSLWITNVAVLRQSKPDITSEPAKLYAPSDVISWRSTPRRGSSGNRKFVGANPDSGAKVCYSLGANVRQIEMTIQNLKGEVVKRFEDLPTQKGLHVMSWDLRRSSTNARRNRFGRRVPAGDYLVNLRVNGDLKQTTLSIQNDPDAPENAVTNESELQWWLDFAGEND